MPQYEYMCQRFWVSIDWLPRWNVLTHRRCLRHEPTIWDGDAVIPSSSWSPLRRLHASRWTYRATYLFILHDRVRSVAHRLRPSQTSRSLQARFALRQVHSHVARSFLVTKFISCCLWWYLHQWLPFWGGKVRYFRHWCLTHFYSEWCVYAYYLEHGGGRW